MFRLSLHLGPLHLDIAVGGTDEEPFSEPLPFDADCVNASFEAYAVEHQEEWYE